MVEVRPVSDPGGRTRHCRALTARLPDWFGIPQANALYAAGIAERDCFGAFDAAGACLGLIALQPHFGRAMEVWWLAVDPDRHGQGIGKALMRAAQAVARQEGFSEMIVMTLSPESDDPGYAATRAFYEALGLRPLIALEHAPEEDPLMWMILRL